MHPLYSKLDANMERINLKQIFLWGQQEGQLINKFRDFGTLPKEGQVICSLCGQSMHLWHDKKVKDWFWICKNSYSGHARKRKKCNNKKSVKAMSIFDGLHLNYEQIMVFIHEWTHHSEIRKISLEANISSRTTANYNKFCTEIVINACFAESRPIGKYTLEFIFFFCRDNEIL